MIDPRTVFPRPQWAVDKRTCTWVVPETLPYFDGHFPGHPVLPGVGVIDASVVYAELALGRPLKLTRVAACKFFNTVSPNDVIQIVFDFSASPYIIHWTREGADICKMSVVLEDHDA